MVSILNSRFYFFFFTCFRLLAIPCLEAQLISEPKNLSLLGQNAASPQIAIDSIGNTTAVWHRFDGQHLIVQGSTKAYEGAWQPIPDNISLPGQNALHPQIAIDSYGNAIAVWERFDGNHFVIESSMKPFGGDWQAKPDQLSDSGQNALHPQVAFDSFGQATVVWQRFDGQHTIIQSSTKSFQQGWQLTPDDLSSEEMNAKNPQIVIDSYDTTTVVWQASDESGEVIQSSIRQFQENWQTTPDVLCSPALSNANPRICVDLFGNVTTVWNRFNGDYGTIQASTLFFGEGWQPIPDTLSVVGQNTFSPQIAVNPWGSVTAVWEGFDENKLKCIHASTKPCRGKWQSVPDLLSLPGDHHLDPQIAIDSSGKVAVVWNNSKGFTRVFISTKALERSWSTPEMISAPGRSGFKPQLAFDFRGRLGIVWTMQEGLSFIQTIEKF